MIVKAAILHDDQIYTGKRHCDVIYEMTRDGICWCSSDIEGFVTDTGEFLNRKDARQHFINVGQVSISGELRRDALYSEDLY